MIELNRIHNMPCLEMFAGLEEQASLIIADPPYGIKYKSNHKEARSMGLQEYKKKTVTKKDRKDIELFDDGTIDVSWMECAYQSLKNNGALYLFTRWDVLHHWNEALLDSGFKVVQRLVWNKGHWGAGDLRYYGSQTEDILFCVKDVHTLRWDMREGNVWKVHAQGLITMDLSEEGGYRHPTQKPTRLFQKIISYSSDPNDLILDPFSGSGAACIAAQRLHRRFVGCDISPTFASAANLWLEDDREHSSLVRTKPMF